MGICIHAQMYLCLVLFFGLICFADIGVPPDAGSEYRQIFCSPLEQPGSTRVPGFRDCGSVVNTTPLASSSRVLLLWNFAPPCPQTGVWIVGTKVELVLFRLCLQALSGFVDMRGTAAHVVQLWRTDRLGTCYCQKHLAPKIAS